MVEHWVNQAVNDGLVFAKEEIVRFNARRARGLGVSRLGVVTGVGSSGAPGLRVASGGLSFALFLVDRFAVDLGRGPWARIVL